MSQVHYICDEMTIFTCAESAYAYNEETISSFFYRVIASRFNRNNPMRSSRAWIIRVNRRPVRQDCILQLDDEVLIGGPYVEHLPFRINIPGGAYARRALPGFCHANPQRHDSPLSQRSPTGALPQAAVNAWMLRRLGYTFLVPGVVTPSVANSLVRDTVISD